MKNTRAKEVKIKTFEELFKPKELAKIKAIKNWKSYGNAGALSVTAGFFVLLAAIWVPWHLRASLTALWLLAFGFILINFANDEIKKAKSD